MLIGHHEESTPDVSLSLEQTEELWVVCGLYTERWSYATACCMVT